MTEEEVVGMEMDFNGYSQTPPNKRGCFCEETQLLAGAGDTS